MNILLSSCVHWWNAEAAYAAALACALRDGGHQVRVLTRPGTPNATRLTDMGVEILGDFPLWSKNPLELWRAIGNLARYQRQQGVEIVNVFRAREMPWHMLANRGASAPRLVRTRGNASGLKGHWLNRRLHDRYCHGLIASCELVRREMADTLGLDPARIHTIYYPAPLCGAAPAQPAPPNPAAARAALLAEFGWPADAVILLMVGRTAPEKGHPLLFEAMRELADRNEKAHLLVMAKPTPGRPQYTASLRQMVTEKGLEGRVAWTGWREDAPALMEIADLGVIPSVNSETNCRVAVEFMAAGTPLAACPTGALPEVIEDGITGRITPGYQPADLAAVLASLVENPGSLAAMGQAARQAAQTRFSPARFLEATLAVYDAALGTPPPDGAGR